MTTTLISKDSKQIISLENRDIDLNEIFSLSYNFDLLKLVLQALTKQNKQTETNFNNVDKLLEQKDKSISNLEVKLVNSVRMLSEKLEEKTKDLEEILRNNAESSEDNSKAAISKLEINFQTLMKRVDTLEKDDVDNKSRIKQLEDQLYELKTDDIKKLKEREGENTHNINELLEKEPINMGKLQRLEKNVFDLTQKFSEINVFEMLKQRNNINTLDSKENKEGKESNNNNNNSDAFYLLLENMKTSFNGKFENIDNKIDALQELANKTKLDLVGVTRKVDISKGKENEFQARIDIIVTYINELKNAINMIIRDNKTGGTTKIIQLDNLTNISKKEDQITDKKDNLINNNNNNNNANISSEELDAINDKIETLNIKIALLEDEIRNNNNNNTDNNGNKTDILLQDNNKDSLTNRDTNNNNNNNNNTNHKNNNSFSTTTHTNIDDSQLKSKLIEIEKTIKVINIREREREDNVNKKINLLTEALKKKVDKDTFYTFSEEVDILKKRLEQFREDYHQTVEKSILEDISWFKKKIESMTFAVNDIKSSSKLVNKDKDIDFYMNDIVGSGKYLEISIFNDYKNFVSKELNGVNNKIEDLRKLIEELTLLINTKANEKDLKFLEDSLLSKIEDFRQAAVKKFADKNETNKNLKYLDANIKQLLEASLKKVEKGDNWLLAKKPFGGNSCASCEAYIGDLNDNREYVPWNKLKDNVERMYRLGTGFSKMLQDNVSFNPQKTVNEFNITNHGNMIMSNSSNFGASTYGNQDTKNSNRDTNYNNNNSVNLLTSMEVKKSNNALPKIRNKNKGNNSNSNNNTQNNLGIVLSTNQNISMEIPEFDENEEEVEVQNNEPKVLKIYKVKKQSPY